MLRKLVDIDYYRNIKNIIKGIHIAIFKVSSTQHEAETLIGSASYRRCGAYPSRVVKTLRFDNDSAW